MPLLANNTKVVMRLVTDTKLFSYIIIWSIENGFLFYTTVMVWSPDHMQCDTVSHFIFIGYIAILTLTISFHPLLPVIFDLHGISIVTYMHVYQYAVHYPQTGCGSYLQRSP